MFYLIRFIGFCKYAPFSEFDATNMFEKKSWDRRKKTVRAVECSKNILLISLIGYR